MPFYPFNEELPLAAVLRGGLNDLRDGRYKLAHVLGVLNQMTAEQVEAAFGFAAGTGASAKAELQSGIGNLLSDNPNVNSAVTYAAVVQMLSMFG